MRRTMRGAVAAGLAVALFALGAIGVVRSDRSSEPAARTDAAVRVDDPVLAPGATVEARIDALQDRLRAWPDDAAALAALGVAHLERSRRTGDPSAYALAEEALERSLALRPDGNVEAVIGLGLLDLARHGFEDALAWGRRAVELNPRGGEGYGVLGDALLELGRYDEAFATFQAMVDTEPGASAYARASYALELRGDVDGAIEAMRLAFDAAGTPAEAAWASDQLGDLYASNGRLTPATDAYRRAIALAPATVEPRAGLAKIAWARGRVDRAIRRLTWVVERSPSPEHVVALGDLYAAAGRPDLAGERYALARAERDLLVANGVNVDLELALFDADHGAPRRALAAARAEWDRRRSVHVADAMAWALHAAGRDRQALAFSRRALRLGTPSAAFHYHAAEIELALGRTSAARRSLADALAIDPHFSFLHAERAAALLERLGGAP